nr:hypothetical protein CFP56_02817 [Quercus suber]
MYVETSNFPSYITRSLFESCHHPLSRSIIPLDNMSNNAMPSLELKLRLPGDDFVDDAIFPIASPAVKSGSEDDLKAAAQAIVFLLLEYKLPSGPVNLRSSFYPVCLEMAEQIPYDSKKMLDVLRLLELVQTSPTLATELTEEDPDRLAAYKESDFSRCLNWHAFVSYLYQRGLVIGPSAPVGLLNEVLENGEPYVHAEQKVRTREIRTMAASQYILRWGRRLLEHLLTTYNSSSPAYDDRAYGYTGSGAQGIEKWHIWRRTLQKITVGGWDENERSISTEAKEMFTKVVKLMDEIEAELATRIK